MVPFCARYPSDYFGICLTCLQRVQAFVDGAIVEINPLRYRGYYYDADTQFYYLQSRYYDAITCRFANADSYAVTQPSEENA